MIKRLWILAAFFVILSVYLFSRQILPVPGLTEDLEDLLNKKAAQWGLEPALLKAIAKVESNFNPAAKNPLDPSYGLMQITPALAYDYGLISDPDDPSAADIQKIYDVKNNVDVAAWFLSYLMTIRPFDVAVQMYNVGMYGYETGARNYTYLNKVRSYYEKYRTA